MNEGNFWLKKSLNDELHEYAERELERQTLWTKRPISKKDFQDWVKGLHRYKNRYKKK
ncbi:MAG: hypothetical protein ACW99G_14505 [Candidatus Thorarchaeota archaeon]|jgi:hypothetical protein